MFGPRVAKVVAGGYHDGSFTTIVQIDINVICSPRLSQMNLGQDNGSWNDSLAQTNLWLSYWVKNLAGRLSPRKSSSYPGPVNYTDSYHIPDTGDLSPPTL